MGRPVARNLEDEMMTKIKKLFDKILETVNKDNPTYTFDFEQFVDCFDENDQFTKRVFEFLVKEIAQRYRSTYPNSQNPVRPRPHTIHHTLTQESGDNNTNSNSSNSSASITQSSHRHHHPHSQRTSHLSHTLATLSRDSIARSPSSLVDSPVPSDGPTANGSSGSALRYLLSNQGFGQGTRRSRIAQRMLSNDLFAYHQGQPSLLSTVSALSNSGSGQNRSLQDVDGATNSDSINVTETETDSTPISSGSLPSASSAASTTRRLSRRGETLERQRAFIYRPRARTSDSAASMETVPESFRTEGWNPSGSGASFASETIDVASGELLIGRPQSTERRLMEQARQLQEQLRQAQEARQQRGQLSSDDTQEQQQHQPHYQLRDNGLMLVQPYPTSPSTPTPITNSTPESTAIGDPSLATPLTSIVESQLPSEESYHEFRDSTQRSRAAMRNALAAELHIEEDHQVLLTGEVSRRRRRRVVGRFSNMGSPDTASDNSSAIISQSQQQQQQQQQQSHQEQQAPEQIPRQSQSQAQQPMEASTNTLPGSITGNSADPSSLLQEPQCDQQQTLIDNSGSSSESLATATELPVPAITVELTDNNSLNVSSNSRDISDSPGSGLDSIRTNLTQGEDQHHNVPPTPPSPNPNRNPMPTFQDRRRSSINPADIEAVVREMRANAQSAIARLGTISSPPMASSERLNQTTQALEDVTNSTQVLPSESSLPSPSSQIGQGGVQPLPLSPPQAEPSADGVSSCNNNNNLMKEKPNSDDETGRYGKARSQPKAESTSPFLTTTNTLPHTHTHKHKGRYEKESKFDIKKPPQASKTESIHFKEPSRPMLTTTNRPSSRGKEVDPNDESIDVQHLQRPFLLNQRRQNDSNESPSRSITKDRRRPSSPESKEKFASSESREKFASPGSRKKFASPGSREKFASPERKKFSSLLKDHRQLQSPTAASPSKLPIKGNVVDLPSDSTAHIESRSLSPPSPPPKLNFEKKNISPKPSRKPTAKRWTESIDSLPDLPETEEEYDALSRRDKVRLGDETIVRRKYRENQRSVCPPSSSAESTQRRTPKEKENEESEKKKSSSGAYQAHHGNSQKGCSEPNSDSDLEDADLFKAQPLGFNAGNKSLYKQASTTVSSDVAATTSPLHSTTLGNFERKAVSTSTESPLKNKGKCTDSTLFKSQSKERRSNESSRTVVDEIELFSSEDSDADFSNSRKARRDPLRGLEGRGGGSNTLVKGVSQDATTKESRASKPMHPTDDDRLIFKGLIPKATHYIGRERLIAKQTRSEGSSANSNTTSKERHESLTTKNRPRDFFDLSNSHKPRSEAPLKPTKATETTFNRNEGLADGNIKRTNIYNRSVKRSPSPSSSSETESTGLSESGFMTSVEQARSRAATPSERGTRKAANKNKDNTEVLTPKSGGFQLPSPRKKKPRMSISSEVMFLSDDDLPNPGLVDTNDADNVCPYCGDALPKVKSARLALALAKVQASLKEKQQQLQPQPQQQNHIVIDLEDDLYNATRDTRNHTLENTSLAPLRGDSIVGKSQPRPRRLDRLKRNTASDTKSSISENEPGEEELGELEEPISPTSPSKGVSLMEKFEFCRVHFAEERIVPLGMEKNYPLHIDFSQLAGRVRKMEGELRKIIDKTEPSIFLEQALSRYKSMGTLGARHPHVVLANVEQTMPGYYGSKGSAELSKILAKLFLETSILTYDLAHPQKPIEYIQQVLVPEAGLRLIVEDQANLKADNVISLEKAREIMFESVEYGNYMYDIHNT
ncbi:hypothetical protein BGX26_012703 [Mortierella sp. AD094]|nr:hypothetical protein BGX26_012703 [Mortierella sp. AD094]